MGFSSSAIMYSHFIINPQREIVVVCSVRTTAWRNVNLVGLNLCDLVCDDGSRDRLRTSFDRCQTTRESQEVFVTLPTPGGDPKIPSTHHRGLISYTSVPEVPFCVHGWHIPKWVLRATSRQRALANQLLQGKSTSEIAEFFGCHPSTIRSHINRLMKEAGISKHEIIMGMLRAGYRAEPAAE
jgi:DNA-binding CsgD family transcriptional regulator